VGVNNLEQKKMFLIGDALQKYCDSSDPHNRCLRFNNVSLQGQTIAFDNSQGNSFELRCNEFQGKYSCDLFKQFKVKTAGGCGGNAGPSMSILDAGYYDPIDIHVEIGDGQVSLDAVEVEAPDDAQVSDASDVPGPADATFETQDVVQVPDMLSDLWDVFASEDAGEISDVPNADVLTQHCDPDGDGIITPIFKDVEMLSAIRAFLGKGQADDITWSDAQTTTWFATPNHNIVDISGLECFSNLEGLAIRAHITDITTLSNLHSLAHLDLVDNDIDNVSALSDLTSLQALFLINNNLSDISPLAGLSELSNLDLSINPIEDFSPLSSLTNLDTLGLASTNLSDISFLAPLVEMVQLGIYDNQISDISTLEYLTNLKSLWIGNNSITDITPLLNNTGIGEGDSVWLDGNDIPQEQIDALEAKGVTLN